MMDIYSSGSGCSGYFIMSPTLIANAYASGGYWWYSPSNSVYDPQGYRVNGIYADAKCNIECRMWDSSNPTVFTSPIRWNGIS